MLARGEVLVKSNFIGMLAACGYDYIELSVVDCIRLTPADRLELKKRLDALGSAQRCLIACSRAS